MLFRSKRECKGNGWTFTGEMMNGIPHGKGIVKYTNGNIFTGNMYNEKRQGEGEMKNSDGWIERSQWIDGKMEGYYELTSSSTGQVEKGCMKGGRIHGPIYSICPQNNNRIQFCLCENGEFTGQVMWIDGEKKVMIFGHAVKGKDNGERRLFKLDSRENSD